MNGHLLTATLVLRPSLPIQVSRRVLEPVKVGTVVRSTCPVPHFSPYSPSSHPLCCFYLFPRSMHHETRQEIGSCCRIDNLCPHHTDHGPCQNHQHPQHLGLGLKLTLNLTLRHWSHPRCQKSVGKSRRLPFPRTGRLCHQNSDRLN